MRISTCAPLLPPTAALLLTLAACSDDNPSDPLEGLYAIDSHVRTTTDCNTTTDVDRAACVDCLVDADLFRLVPGSHLGHRYLALQPCTAPDDCDDTSPLAAGSTLFDQRNYDGWSGQLPVTAFSNGTCSYTQTTISAVAVGADQVRLTESVGTANAPATSAAECFAAFEPPPEASSLSCVSIEVVEATRRQ